MEENKKAFLEEVDHAIALNEYQEVQRIHTRLEPSIPEERSFDEQIHDIIEKAYDKADATGKGMAERFATVAKENREEGKKRGRPREHESGRQCSIWLEQGLIDDLKKLSEQSGKSVSEIAAFLIQQGFALSGGGLVIR